MSNSIYVSTEELPVSFDDPEPHGDAERRVLIGIPTVQFGTINQLVEQIAVVPGTIVETPANDGAKI